MGQKESVCTQIGAVSKDEFGKSVNKTVGYEMCSYLIPKKIISVFARICLASLMI